MSERFWGGWPVWPPKPRRATLREHRLADPPVNVPGNVCRYGSLRPVRRSRLGAPICLLLLLGYALPVGVLLAVYSPEPAPPPAASEPMDVDPLILVPVDEMPDSDRSPEPPLELTDGEKGVAR